MLLSHLEGLQSEDELSNLVDNNLLGYRIKRQ